MNIIKPYMDVSLPHVSYPYLTPINSVLPAIIAGNSVLLKPSPQTPLTAERLALALERAGLPENIFQVVHLSPLLATFVVQHPVVSFVSFTGSVAGGRSVEKAATEAIGIKGVALEVNPHLPCGPSVDKYCLKLGGKDPAYVRQDAEVAYTAAELADGEKHSMVSLAAASPVFQGHSSTLARVAALSRWELSDLNIRVIS